MGQKSNLPIMPTKTYSEEFKLDAVALYENSDGASLQQIANNLGVNRITLKTGSTSTDPTTMPQGRPHLWRYLKLNKSDS